jgi:hypothetical protein
VSFASGPMRIQQYFKNILREQFVRTNNNEFDNLSIKLSEPQSSSRQKD